MKASEFSLSVTAEHAQVCTRKTALPYKPCPCPTSECFLFTKFIATLKRKDLGLKPPLRLENILIPKIVLAFLVILKSLLVNWSIRTGLAEIEDTLSCLMYQNYINDIPSP